MGALKGYRRQGIGRFGTFQADMRRMQEDYYAKEMYGAGVSKVRGFCL